MIDLTADMEEYRRSRYVRSTTMAKNQTKKRVERAFNQTTIQRLSPEQIARFWSRILDGVKGF